MTIENTKKIFTESEFTDHVNGIIRGIERHYNKPENEGQKKKILIFAHGGLNSFNSSLDRAKKDYIKIKDADEYYPIFFNWHSSWYSSLGERLFTVRRGKVRGRFYRIISFPFVFASTLGKGIGNSLLSSFYQVENDLSTIPGYYRSDAENVDSLFVVFKKKALSINQDNEMKIFLARDDKRNIWNRTADGLRYFHTIPWKYSSGWLIDSAGKDLWENMLRHTNTAYWKPEEFDIENDRNVITTLVSPAKGALSEFMKELTRMIKQDSITKYEITLIGHSMGAILINEMIRLYPELPISNIVYMAAACSIQDFQHSVIPYLVDNDKAKFYNLSLHPISERSENNVWDLIHRGSLLTWIGNFFASPSTHLDRTLGRWENVIQATHIIPDDIIR